MTDTAAEPLGVAVEGQSRDLCLCESYARVTERTALAGARWLGRANDESAERDAE